MRRIGAFRAVVCLVLVVSASSGDGAEPEPAKGVFTAIVGIALGGPTSAEIIRRATASTLAKADELGAKSLALVAFGTGVGGFPLDCRLLPGTAASRGANWHDAGRR